MGLKETSDATFEADVLKNDKPVLVDFWAPWCGPCRQIAPVLEELAAGELGQKIDFVKLNTDENMKTAAKYGITGIPTMNIYVGGDVAESFVGVMPKHQLAQALERYAG